MKELAEFHLAPAYVLLADTVALCETGKCAYADQYQRQELKEQSPGLM